MKPIKISIEQCVRNNGETKFLVTVLEPKLHAWFVPDLTSAANLILNFEKDIMKLPTLED